LQEFLPAQPLSPDLQLPLPLQAFMPLQAWRSEPFALSDFPLHESLPPQPAFPPQLFWLTSVAADADPAAGTITPAPAIMPAIAALTRSFFIF
jgi:hypothetical protein